MVRLSVEKMAGAIGLVEGGTSFTQVRLKSMQKGSLNFTISFLLKHNHLTSFEFKFERLPFCHIFSEIRSHFQPVRPSVRPFTRTKTPQTRRQLEQVLVAEWSNIPHVKGNHILSMRQRCLAVVQANRGHTRY